MLSFTKLLQSQVYDHDRYSARNDCPAYNKMSWSLTAIWFFIIHLFLLQQQAGGKNALVFLNCFSVHSTVDSFNVSMHTKTLIVHRLHACVLPSSFSPPVQGRNYTTQVLVLHLRFKKKMSRPKIFGNFKLRFKLINILFTPKQFRKKRKSLLGHPFFTVSRVTSVHLVNQFFL